MRLVSWNCRKGRFEFKTAMLHGLRPDISVIQECAKSAVQSNQCLWWGDNNKQGIAVLVGPSYRLQALPVLAGVPKFVTPVAVTGAQAFTLLAVWSKKNADFPYVEGEPLFAYIASINTNSSDVDHR